MGKAQLDEDTGKGVVHLDWDGTAGWGGHSWRGTRLDGGTVR